MHQHPLRQGERSSFGDRTGRPELAILYNADTTSLPLWDSCRTKQAISRLFDTSFWGVSNFNFFPNLMVQNRHQNRRFIGVYGRIMHNFNFFISLIARLYRPPQNRHIRLYTYFKFYKKLKIRLYQPSTHVYHTYVHTG
jgi:hypothetical protein